jgi:hypothetical protein
VSASLLRLYFLVQTLHLCFIGLLPARPAFDLHLAFRTTANPEMTYDQGDNQVPMDFHMQDAMSAMTYLYQGDDQSPGGFDVQQQPADR